MQNMCVCPGSLQIKFTDLGLVGLLHQFRWRCASAPHPSTYAMCVLPTYPLYLELIFVHQSLYPRSNHISGYLPPLFLNCLQILHVCTSRVLSHSISVSCGVPSSLTFCHTPLSHCTSLPLLSFLLRPLAFPPSPLVAPLHCRASQSASSSARDRAAQRLALSSGA